VNSRFLRAETVRNDIGGFWAACGWLRSGVSKFVGEEEGPFCQIRLKGFFCIVLRKDSILPSQQIRICCGEFFPDLGVIGAGEAFVDEE
jgi:hypothetical protein